MKKIIKLLKDTFMRKRFYLRDYFCQTNTLKECWVMLKYVLTFKRFKYDTAIYDYEKKAAKVMGAKYAYSYASGRQSLYAILKALNIGEGDEIIVQSFTCVAVSRAIIYTGSKPIYCDIDSSTFNMDYSKISSLITEKTKAIVVQHTFGNIADIEKIKDIISLAFRNAKVISATETMKYLEFNVEAEKRKIYIIEDFAHAVGCGKLKGDVGFYSSDHTKMISTSTGGMAFTNDEDIRRNLELDCYKYPFLSNTRIFQIAFTFIVETIITHPKVYWLLRPLRILLDKTRIFFFFRDENKLEKPKNYPLRLSNLQSVIGISQLENLEEQIEKRKRFTKEFIYPNCLLRTVWIQSYKVDRELWPINTIKIGTWFDSPIFGCKDLSTVHYEEGSCPVAEDVCKKIVNLPIPLR